MSNENKYRYSKVCVVVGERGTGKTTFLSNLISSIGQKVIVCTPHVYEWNTLIETKLENKSDFDFVGAKKHVIQQDYTLSRLKCFCNGYVFFDDCLNFLPSNPKSKEGKDFIQFLISGRHQSVDFFVIAHGLTQISPCFYPYITDIFMFKTLDNLVLCKNKLLEYKKIVDLQKRVNAKAQKNPY